MTITFNGIPATIRTPGTFVEVDNSMALQGLQPWYQKALLLGQMFTADIEDDGSTVICSAGTATVNELVFVASYEQAELLFGAGSMLARMVKAFKAANPYIECWCIPQGAGTGQSIDTWTITGSATAAGTVSLMVGGVPVRVSVSSGDSAGTVGDAIEAAINQTYLTTPVYVYANNGSGQLTLRAKNVGLLGNDLDMRVNYYNGEETPSGLTIPAIVFESGTGNPSLTTAITNMGDEQFDYIVCPYHDSTNLGLLETELDRRFGPLVQLQGFAFTAVKDAYADLALWCDTNSRNNPHVSAIGFDDAPTPSDEWAASYAGVASYYLNIDPARPLQTLPLPGVLPPPPTSIARLTRSERDILLNNGIATYIIDAGGRVLIDRAITNYTENGQGVPDTSYLDVNTMLTLAYIRDQFRNRMSNRFPRHKLADDGTRIAPGQAVARPKDIRMETIALFGDLEDAGIIEGLDDFKTNLVVERNGSDVNRVDVLLPADLVNQFRILAAKLQYIL